MAGAQKRRQRVATFPWRTLRAALSDDERSELRAGLERLLAWQARLGSFPAMAWAPDATPFVSIYAKEKLRGCFGTDEGPPEERLCRAFLRALEDSRFGLVAPEERAYLSAQVSYPLEAQAHAAADIAEHLEVGTHGVACVREGRLPVNLLPQVARDNGLDANQLLHELGVKAGLGGAKFSGSYLFSFRTEDVAARRDARAPSPFRDALAEGYDWLAALVAPNGRVEFAIDPRSGQRARSGPMRHGRVAVAIRALGDSRRHARAAGSARRWLDGEVARALRGDAVEGWPDDPAMVAGTLALICQAGIDLRRELLAHAAKPELLPNVWHAAQVVSVLGRSAPAKLYRCCVADLARQPWAPWTMLAARELHDRRTIERCERALIDSLRSVPPHRGGAGVTRVPEIALTAIAIEALAGLPSREAKSAVARGREFLRRWQIGAHVPASLDPDLARGAFPASPVSTLLRCDMTGHALLALRGR